MEGKIIKNISNIYIVNSDGNKYEATARGKFKIDDVKPVVGDNVEFEITDVNNAVITKILDRKTFLKRPKVSNISQIVFVISPKMPNTNFIMLDKGLCFSEFLGINSTIVINKTDLDEIEANRILNLYTKTGYRVIKTSAQKGEGIENLRKVLKNNTSALSRKFWSTASLQLQIKS